MVGPSSYVDVNVFVYWLGNHPSFGQTAYIWIKKIENAKPGEYITSSLTLYETLVIVTGLTGRSLKDTPLIERVIDSMIRLKGLVIEPLKLEDFIQAVELMKEYDVDYEDSIHLAIALRKNVKKIVSNDEDFDKTPLKRTF